MRIQEWGKAVGDSVGSVFFGSRQVIEQILTAVLCRGHVLIEDVPGVGKTILARAAAASLGGTFARIQCTPDLMPTDIIGVSVYNPADGKFTFRPGPIEANIVLVDEINRATPRTQSALLEAMAEGQISIDHEVRKLPSPFLVLATENPIDFEGTYPLPEAQKDRFFLSLSLGYPSGDAEMLILEAQNHSLSHPVENLTAVSLPEDVPALQNQVLEVYVSTELRRYILGLTAATRESSLLKLGVSPRGSLALFHGAQALAALRGRDFVIPEDIRELAPPIFSKRIILKPEQAMKGMTEDIVIRRCLEQVPVPVPGKPRNSANPPEPENPGTSGSSRNSGKFDV